MRVVSVASLCSKTLHFIISIIMSIYCLQNGGVGSLEATAALLSQVSGGSEGPLLHHLEELARRDQEVAQLKRDKRQLETTMREVQMAAIVRQQAQQDTIEALQEEAERWVWTYKHQTKPKQRYTCIHYYQFTHTTKQKHVNIHSHPWMHCLILTRMVNI